MKTSETPEASTWSNAAAKRQRPGVTDLRPRAQVERQLSTELESSPRAMRLKSQAALLDSASYRVALTMASPLLPAFSDGVIQPVVVARVDFTEADPAAMNPVTPKVAAVTLMGRPNVPYVDGGGGGQGDHVVGYVLFEHAVKNAITGRTFMDAVIALKGLVDGIRSLPGFAIGRDEDRNYREGLVRTMETDCGKIIDGTRVVADINKATVLAGLCESYLNARSSLRLVSRNSASNDGAAPEPNQVRNGARNLDEFIALDDDEADKMELGADDIAAVTAAMWGTFDYRPANLGNGRAPVDSANAVITLVMTTFQSYPNIVERWKWPIVAEIVKDFLEGEGVRWGWDENQKKIFSDAVQVGLH